MRSENYLVPRLSSAPSLRVVLKRVPRRALTRADQDSIIGAVRRGTSGSPALRQLTVSDWADALRLPSEWPLLEDAIGGEGGVVWLKVGSPDGRSDVWLRAAPGPLSEIHELTMPSSWRPVFFGRDYLWYVVRDSLGVEYLRRRVIRGLPK